MKVNTNKAFQRLLFLILFGLILVIKVHILLIYVVVFYLSFEYLNQHKNYLQMVFYQTYNWLFLAFLSFIILVRANLFEFSETTHYHLNSLEHLFFSGIICLILTIYLSILNVHFKTKFWYLLAIFIIFNGIGLCNEYFQNYFQHSEVFLLKKEDCKDVIINLIGSTLFVTALLFTKIKN